MSGAFSRRWSRGPERVLFRRSPIERPERVRLEMVNCNAEGALALEAQYLCHTLGKAHVRKRDARSGLEMAL